MANPFRERAMRVMYDAALTQAQDNRSEYYVAKLSSGPIYGPAWPRRGAGHRCGFWDGFYAVNSLYARSQGTLGYAAFRAGQAFRKQVGETRVGYPRFLRS